MKTILEEVYKANGFIPHELNNFEEWNLFFCCT